MFTLDCQQKRIRPCFILKKREDKNIHSILSSNSFEFKVNDIRFPKSVFVACETDEF